MLVGLHVVDDAAYDAYRAGMKPILHAAGGSFGNDFRVGETLRTEATHPVNRVFTIRFPDRRTKDAFYADPAYLAVRSRHFEGAVAGRTILAEYER